MNSNDSRQRARRLQALFDHTRDAIIFFDDEARIIDLNPATCILLGYDEGDLLSRSAWDVVARLDEAQKASMWGRFLQSGTRSGKLRLRRQDGSTIVVDANAVANVEPGLHMAILRDVTEEHERERERRRNDARLQLFMEQIPAVIWIMNSKLHFTSLMGRGVQEWGLDRAALLGREVREIVTPEEEEAIMPVLHAALQGRSGTVEVELRDLSLLSFVEPLHDGAGEIVGVIGLTQNQSQQKQLEQALHRSQQEFRALVEHAPDIISRHDLQGRHLYVNPAIIKATGLPPEVFLGKTNADLGMPEELLGIWTQVHRDVLESGEEHVLEYAYPAPNGTRHFQSRVVPEFDSDGVIVSTLNVARDITALKEAEEKLREAQVLLTTLLDHAPVPIYATAADGTQLLVNSAWKKTFGLTREAIEGEPLGALLSDKMAQQFLASDQIVLDSHEPLTLEESVLDSMSNLRDFYTVKFPLVDANEEVNAVGGISIDITERNRARDALRQFAERMEILHQIDQGILAARSVEEIAGNIVPHLPALLPCNRASVSLVDESGTGSTTIAVESDRSTTIAVGERFNVEGGILKNLLKEDMPYATMTLSDFAHLPVAQRMLGEGLCSVTVFPIRVHGKLLASLNLASEHPDPFTEEDLAIAGQVADSLAVALQQSRMTVSLRKQGEQLEVLRQVALELTAELELDTLLESVVRHAINLCGAAAGGLYLHRPEQECLEWAVAIGEGMSPPGSTLRCGEGLSGKVWERNEPMIVNDYKSWPGRAPQYAGYPWETVMAVPISGGGRLLGVLNVQRSQRLFTQEEADLLALLATQAAIAIQNARLFEAERTAHYQTERIRKATAALTAALDLERVLDSLLLNLQQVVPYHSSTVFLHRDDGLYAVAARGQTNSDEIVGTCFPSDGGLFPIIRKSGQPIILDDATLDPRFLGWNNTSYVRGWMAVPLKKRGKIMGYLTLDSYQPESYGPEEAELAVAFANQAATAIENAQLFEAERLHRKQAEMLQAANVALTESLELERVLEQLLFYLEQMIPFDSAAVLLLEDPWRAVVRAGRGFEPWIDPSQLLGQSLDASPGSIIYQTVASGKSYRIPDIHEVQGWQQIQDMPHVRSWVGVPLIAGGQWIGIYSMDKAVPHFFTAEHCRLAESLAAQAAVAIQNATLFAEVENGRERLQRLSAQLIEVQESERRHIARELHDEIGQVLTGLSLSLEMGSRPPIERAHGHLQQARALISDLMERVDALSLDLRPSMLDDLGLLPALIWHVERYQMQSGIKVHLKQSGIGETRFDSAVETAAYRIVQEALTNIARHAAAPEAWIRLVANEGVLHIQIRDKGAGFDRETRTGTREGRGLSGIYERATLLGGMLLVQSAVGQGTLLTVILPLDRQSEETNRKGAL